MPIPGLKSSKIGALAHLMNTYSCGKYSAGQPAGRLAPWPVSPLARLVRNLPVIGASQTGRRSPGPLMLLVTPKHFN